MFDPACVAVVGASPSGKQGNVFVQGLLDPGFKGDAFVVHPTASEVMGLPAYPRVSALPRRPDLAILVLPSEPAIEVVRDCAKVGVPGVALFTAGFNELGTEEGHARARALLEAAGGKTRLIGPNGMGIYNPRRGVAMFPKMSQRTGSIGFISQSGSLTSFTVRDAAERGLGFSAAVSMGNQLDLNAADFLEYFGEDPETQVIGAYVEGVPDGRRFQRVLRDVASRKRVILWKAGRVAAGAKAAHSHTGQLAGSYAVWQGLARQAGAILVREADELVDTLVAANALLRTRQSGRRVAIVTGPGGPAVSASDACEEAGLALAELSEDSRSKLREVVAAAGTSVANPIDVGMALVGATELYRRCLEVALADPGVDAALVIGVSRGDSGGFAEMLADVTRETGKPLMYVVGPEQQDRRMLEMLAEAGVATAPTAERALRAYARVA